MADQKEKKRRPKKKSTAAQSALDAAQRARKARAAKAIQAKNPGMSLAEAVKRAESAPAKSDAQLNDERASGRGYKTNSEVQREQQAQSGKAMSDTADRVIANAKRIQGQDQGAPFLQGVLSVVNQAMQDNARRAALPHEIADPRLYGSGKRAERSLAATREMQAAKDRVTFNQLSKNGQAIWMGPKAAPKVRSRFDDDFAQTKSDAGLIAGQAIGDNIQSKAELMSWLSDPKQLEAIRKKMVAAGFDVQNYNDIAKLWTSVVEQAADTYSFAHKKVTPWAILSLRGKQTVNGRPASRTVTSTSTDIEELDPAQARIMLEDAATKALGRAPTDEELDAFAAKAQSIAAANPRITKTNTRVDYDFAGRESNRASTSTSSGGSDVTAAKARVAAEDMAEQSPDYEAYQTAGVYMPYLFEALGSPV